MIPYFILCAFVIKVAFFDLTNLKNNRILQIILFVVLLLFIGTRDNIGTDWWIYEGFFAREDEGWLVEPGYNLLQVIVRFFSGSFYQMVFLTAFISLIVKFWAFNKVSPLVFTSLLFYVAYYYIPQDANQVRQGLAAGILLFSIPYLANRNIKKFLIIVALSSLFHISSLAFVILIPLARFRKWDTSFFLWLVGFSFLFLFINLNGFFAFIISEVILRILPIDFASAKLEAYLFSKYSVSQGFYLGSLFLLYFVGVFSIYRKTIDSEIFQVGFLVFVLGVVLNFFFSSFAVLGRLTFHFILVGAILYGFIVFNENKLWVKAYHIMVLGVIMILKVHNFITNDLMIDDYIPYKSILVLW